MTKATVRNAGIYAAKTGELSPHQLAALGWLDEQLTAEQAQGFSELWRAHGSPAAKPAGRQGRAVPTTGGGWRLEGFPFCSQVDPSDGPEGWRQCQSSSIAMALRFLKVPGIADDTDYMKVVRQFGDTTAQDAHRKALAKLKVQARFVQNCTVAQAQAEIKAGLPVVAGVLHHGPATAPTGGGHYVTLFGFDGGAKPTWHVHDPYGELNLVAGGWARQGGGAGRDQRYSFRNFNPRWLPEGPASGWAWLFS